MHDLQNVRKGISIIIPALNEEKLIERTLSQFTKEVRNRYDLEIIVSDGGSRDSTLSIAGKYADRIVDYRENFPQNISQGRNAGAMDSQRDVLIFLNADTIIRDPELFFNEIIKEISDDGISAVACKIEVFPEERKLSDTIFHGFYNNYTAMLNKFFMGMGRGECHIIPRKYFLMVNGYDENLAAGEDFDLYKRLRKFGKIKFRRDLVIYESPRRYRRFGYPRVIWDWGKNSVSVFLFKKSISKEWEAIR
ncbi:MAG TPA: glycosyltransferase [Ignavibacteria bacterium]|nr:glycosyltransferase [Ignavibacteria bacterium]HMR39037.1 glycosyltransferase [Ignavibacteria bacterium]